MQAPETAYEIHFAVSPEEIDELGHVNNVNYLRWVQDAATAHWRAAAPPADQERLVWVVLRHEIDYKAPARLGDAIIARTWVGSATKLRFERYVEILRASDRRLLARALTLWCPLDAKTLRPTDAGAEIRSVFSRPAAE
jgi:acyl-CoA thioester hydrolase